MAVVDEGLCSVQGQVYHEIFRLQAPAQMRIIFFKKTCLIQLCVCFTRACITRDEGERKIECRGGMSIHRDCTTTMKTYRGDT